MNYQITVRYSAGQGRQRYHLDAIEADDLAMALQMAADRLPAAVAESGDLVEIRPEVSPEERPYLDEVLSEPSQKADSDPDPDLESNPDPDSDSTPADDPAQGDTTRG